jgi:hypothetical protein
MDAGSGNLFPLTGHADVLASDDGDRSGEGVGASAAVDVSLVIGEENQRFQSPGFLVVDWESPPLVITGQLDGVAEASVDCGDMVMVGGVPELVSYEIVW